MRFAVLASLMLTLGACSNNQQNPTPDSTVDATPSAKEGGGAEAVAQKAVGEACGGDKECVSGICFASKCAKACTAPTDCTAEQDCSSDDGKRYLCVTRAYAEEIGTSCAVTGTCSRGKCLGGAESAYAYCTAECKLDTDCPPAFFCRELRDKTKVCAKRGFCFRCQYDAQCGSGKCLKVGSESFCTKSCTKDSTECPRVADCKDVGGSTYCVHRSGSCVGDGSQCTPCTLDTDCKGTGSLCLSYVWSGEAFCSNNCDSRACPTSSTQTFECYGPVQLSATESVKQCVPVDTVNPKDKAQPTCLKAGLKPSMEVGDIMDDFAMVGYVDENKDNSLVGETLRVVKLSEFASSAKIILFNISAGWCPVCQEETQGKGTNLGFADLMAKYRDQGLMIFQVLNDSDVYGGNIPPSVKLLDAWNVKMKAAGACGIDPAYRTMAWDTAGSVPLNMILDAKTRKVLAKFVGLGAESAITKYLPAP